MEQVDKARDTLSNLRAEITTATQEALRYKQECDAVVKTRDALRQAAEEIREELSEYQEKQKAINKSIAREREKQEQLDFYRIALTDEAKDDITTLCSFRDKLHFPQFLDKIIYDSYIAVPVNEMIKRVLGGKEPSGIYKITRLSTNEVYIGKSTNIKNRWQQHCKTAYNVGTISHSTLHTIMKKDGIDNFTFEVIEEVEKDKLGDREKYWIDFY